MAKPPRKRTRNSTSAKNAKEPGPVGPGNPPVGTRFKPGVSGNPKGRPRKERNLVRLIEIELDLEVSLTENGESLLLTKREALAKRMVNDALKGDAKAITALMKVLSASSDSNEPESVDVDKEAIESFLSRLVNKGGDGK